MTAKPDLSRSPHDDSSGGEKTIEAWGNYLNRFKWEHWCTLTPRFTDCSSRALRRAFIDQFVRRLARVAGQRINWFYAMERSLGGVLHLHSFLAGTSCLQIDRIRGAWSMGFSDVHVFDPLRRAPYYSTKLMGVDDLNCEVWDHSRRMPPLRQQTEQPDGTPF